MNFKVLLSNLDALFMAIVKPIVIVFSLFIAGALTLGIILRVMTDSPMFGLEELVLISVMWLYMLGAILASRDRTHLAADLIIVITKNKKVIQFMRLFASILSLIIAIFFCTWSYDLLVWAVEKKQTTPVFHLPWYLSQSSLFFASIFFAVYLVRDVVNDLTALLLLNSGNSASDLAVSMSTEKCQIEGEC